MRKALPVALTAALLAASGVAHGLWTNRWGTSAALEAAAARCSALPLRLGDWEGRDVEIDHRQITMAQAQGYLSRQYVHRGTGQALSVLLLCGRAGPISVHPPEVCYQASGYTLVGQRKAFEVPARDGGPGATFLAARFNKGGATPDPLRVFWSFSTGGPWEVPDREPRLAFAGHPFLYKLYVIERLARTDESPQDDLARDFLRALLPELQRHVLTP